MIRADSVEVSWDAHKKKWNIKIQAGEEVIKRPVAGTSRDAAEDALRSLAIQTAHDDGYEVDSSAVKILR